jgi:hypothetical protein
MKNNVKSKEDRNILEMEWYKDQENRYKYHGEIPHVRNKYTSFLILSVIKIMVKWNTISVFLFTVYIKEWYIMYK